MSARLNSTGALQRLLSPATNLLYGARAATVHWVSRWNALPGSSTTAQPNLVSFGSGTPFSAYRPLSGTTTFTGEIRCKFTCAGVGGVTKAATLDAPSFPAAGYHWYAAGVDFAAGTAGKAYLWVDGQRRATIDLSLGAYGAALAAPGSNAAVALGPDLVGFDWSEAYFSIWDGYCWTDDDALANFQGQTPDLFDTPPALYWTGLSSNSNLIAVGDAGAVDLGTLPAGRAGPNGVAAIVGAPAWQSGAPVYVSPVSAGVAQVDPSGSLLFFLMQDTNGTPANVQALAATPAAFFSVRKNGGTAVALDPSHAGAVWDLTTTPTSKAHSLPFLACVIPGSLLPVLASDALTYSDPGGAVVCGPGASVAVADAGVQNLVGSEFPRLGFVGPGQSQAVPVGRGAKAMALGYNVHKLDTYQLPILANRAKHTRQGWGGATAAVDADNNLLAVTAGGTATCNVCQDTVGPTLVGGAPYTPGYRTGSDGKWTFRYKPHPSSPTATVNSGGFSGTANTAVSNVQRRTISPGWYEVTATLTKDPASRTLGVSITSTDPVTAVEVFDPDTDCSDVNNPPLVHPYFVRGAGRTTCLRLMDTAQTNSSTVVDGSGFRRPSEFSYSQAQGGGVTVAIGVSSVATAPNADNYLDPTHVTLLLTLSSPAPANLRRDGVVVDVSSTFNPGGSGNTGKLALSNGAYGTFNGLSPGWHYVDPTHVSFTIPQSSSGGVAVNPVTFSAGAVTLTYSNSPGLPLEYYAVLARALPNLTSLWACLPHALAEQTPAAQADRKAWAAKILGGYNGLTFPASANLRVQVSNEITNSASAFKGQYAFFGGKGNSFDWAGSGLTRPPLALSYTNNQIYWYSLACNQTFLDCRAAAAEAGYPASKVVRVLGGWFSNQGINNAVLSFFLANGMAADECCCAPYQENFVYNSTTQAAFGATLKGLPVSALVSLGFWNTAYGKFWSNTSAFVNACLATATNLPVAPVCYEFSDETYCQSTSSDDVAAWISRQGGRHPRVKDYVQFMLQRMNDLGFTLCNFYLLFGNNNQQFAPSDANWPTYFHINQVAGDGRGTVPPGSFVNTADLDDVNNLVSVKGYAFEDWSSLVAGASSFVALKLGTNQYLVLRTTA